jgi:hypothetical protein
MFCSEGMYVIPSKHICVLFLDPVAKCGCAPLSPCGNGPRQLQTTVSWVLLPESPARGPSQVTKESVSWAERFINMPILDLMMTGKG